MNEAIKRRLAELRAKVVPETCFCLVALPDGTEAEKTIDEWWENRDKWIWKRMTRGSNPGAVLLVLASIDEEVAEHCLGAGDTAGAMRFLAEAEQYRADYERSVNYETS